MKIICSTLYSTQLHKLKMICLRRLLPLYFDYTTVLAKCGIIQPYKDLNYHAIEFGLQYSWCLHCIFW